MDVLRLERGQRGPRIPVHSLQIFVYRSVAEEGLSPKHDEGVLCWRRHCVVSHTSLSGRGCP